MRWAPKIDMLSTTGKHTKLDAAKVTIGLDFSSS